MIPAASACYSTPMTLVFLLLMLGGLILYLATKDKLAEVGRLMFFACFLALMIAMAAPVLAKLRAIF